MAGFASLYLIGTIKDLTQSTNIGLYVLAWAIVVLSVAARRVNC